MISQIQSSSPLIERLARAIKSPEVVKLELAQDAIEQRRRNRPRGSDVSAAAIDYERGEGVVTQNFMQEPGGLDGRVKGAQNGSC